MENSPPGIHTMPSGARPGAGILFSTVGKNNERFSQEVSGIGLERRAANARIPRSGTPNRIMAQVHLRPRRSGGRALDCIDFERLWPMAHGSAALMRGGRAPGIIGAHTRPCSRVS